MDFNEFSRAVTIIAPVEAEKYRKQYIRTFVNRECQYYKDKIKTLKHFSDGWCYTGYLWDCLHTAWPIHWNTVVSYRNVLHDVLVFWDIHSCERILIPDYWKFPKNACLELSYTELCLHRNWLPEDIYIFDRSYTWTIVFTHETTENEQPLFLQSGEPR